MSINVYWTRSVPSHRALEMVGASPNEYLSPMRLQPPEPLLKHIDYKNFLGPSVSQCPAIVDDIKNTFVIKSPVDVKIKIQYPHQINIEHQSLEFGKAFLGPPQGKFGIHQLGFGFLFFAEKSLVACQLPAYYDENDFTKKTFTISGSFDVGQWFRIMAKPAFKFRKGITEIDIREGDALLYVRFNTTEKVKLIEFDDTELQKLEEKSPDFICGSLKKQDAGKIISLEKCYEYFNAYKMRQRVMKLIKNNLIKGR